MRGSGTLEAVPRACPCDQQPWQESPVPSGSSSLPAVQGAQRQQGTACAVGGRSISPTSREPPSHSASAGPVTGGRRQGAAQRTASRIIHETVPPLRSPYAGPLWRSEGGT